MLPVSDAFLAAVRGSHRIVSRARVITPGVTGANPAGVDLRILDGSVTLDATADVRGSLDLTVVEPWPDGNTTADLVPYGTEVAISRGIVFGNGAIERAPLGIYRLVTVEQDDAPAGALRISAQDRMSGIVEARMLTPVSYAASETFGEVVTELVEAVYPAAVIEWDDASDLEPIGRKVVVEEDRYGFLRELVTSLGKVFFWDYRGVLVIRDPPDPTVPVWDVDAGASGVLVEASRALSREEVYNAVVATGEALDDVAPPLGIAYDLDPTSVTYWNGDFGKVPRRFSSPFITTNAQAVKAAQNMLAEALGLPYAVDLSVVPNPALEPLDVVRVTYPPDRTRSPAVRQETHVLDVLTIPLNPAGTLTASTRLQTSGGTG